MALQFYSWRRIEILIVFFIIFWLFSSISKKARSHSCKVPPFQCATSQIVIDCEQNVYNVIMWLYECPCITGLRKVPRICNTTSWNFKTDWENKNKKQRLKKKKKNTEIHFYPPISKSINRSKKQLTKKLKLHKFNTKKEKKKNVTLNFTNCFFHDLQMITNFSWYLVSKICKWDASVGLSRFQIVKLWWYSVTEI